MSLPLVARQGIPDCGWLQTTAPQYFGIGVVLALVDRPKGPNDFSLNLCFLTRFRCIILLRAAIGRLRQSHSTKSLSLQIESEYAQVPAKPYLHFTTSDCHQSGFCSRNRKTGKLDFDCVFLSRPNAHKFFTVDFEKRTVNEQPAMIGPEAMHWKLGDHGYKFDRLTGILALLKVSNNVLFKLQCNAVTER